ncbi:MAG: LysR family transcriptional regulator [Oscillospiraceae bacterium]|nr:LysR family transcriptional regulator [Oscillospiraceae bacterium]MDY3066020.1 LysR family transcriptional regulator [Oscillospiraceae bacterium]
MIETRLISYFLAVAREQSITKAANVLHITQPTLSKQMMELEKELGCRLFIRGKKQITLTEEGHYFRRRAQEVIELLTTTEATLHSEEQFISGEITLGCGETAQMKYIAAKFAGLHALYPEVRLNLYSANTEAVLERMDKGLVDVGLLLNPPIHEKYEYMDLGYSDRFGLLMPKNCALAQKPWISVNDLKRLPLLVSAQTFSRFEQSSFPLSETEIQVVSCYNLIYNASYFVEQGLGYALTLDGLIDTSNRALTFRLIKPFIEAPWKLVTKKYLPQAPAVKAFIGLFCEAGSQ